MAARYWVGGTGTWDSTTTTNWSATSGGAGGASAPTSIDNVYFDANSGSGVCTTDATAAGSGVSLNSNTLSLVLGADLILTASFTLTLGAFDLNNNALTTTAFSSSNTNTRSIAFGTGKIALTGSGAAIWVNNTATNFSITGTPTVELTTNATTGTRTIQGPIGPLESQAIDFYIKAGSDLINFTGSAAGFGKWDFTGFSGTARRQNSITVYRDITLSPTMSWELSTSGTLSLAGASGDRYLTTNGVAFDARLNIATTGATWKLVDNLDTGDTSLYLNSGTFDANDKNVTCLGVSSSGTSVRTINMGSGTWTITGSGLVFNVSETGMTLNAQTSTIKFTSSLAKTFGTGVNFTYYNIEQAGDGYLTISGPASFNDLTASVVPSKIIFRTPNRFTFTNFSLSGTSGNLVTIESDVAGSDVNFVKTSGTVNVQYLSIRDVNAIGGATWNAYTVLGNVDAGNNNGWNFYNSSWQRRLSMRIGFGL